MLLNLGCGEFPAAGWVNTDLHADGPRPDVVCSMLALPFPDSTAERVYCGHVLEHIAPADLPRALGEVRRVLRDDGELMVVGPDVNLTMLFEPNLLAGVTDGGCRWPGDEHQWVATCDGTLGWLFAAGFCAHPTSVADIPESWPVAGRDPWQFAIRATLKE